MSDWKADLMPFPRIGPMGWLRVLWRGGVLGAVTYGGLGLLLLLRLVEAPLFGMARPWTPHITQFVCRSSFRILGIPLTVTGTPMEHHGAMVANHASWLDIFALNACARIYFVAKAEVEGWAGIGWLARATGTLFIARKGSEAKKHLALFEERLRAGHRLLFFPEGTSTDSRRVVPFKTTLFEAFYTHGMDRIMHIQPVTLVYHPPENADPRFYGWWGAMEFAPHLLMVLSAPQQGRVEVIFHPEVPVDAFENRKVLAAHCERVVRTSLPFAE
ncbi:lysophospholipid acyltransferase family protein [Thioclava sp. FR2]|uniref:lysophospholipid acyltransferase family protein n=1 Tax=Thioclava sp. FR2 TaxID=3445780 RepID=UPI003EB9F745